MEFVDLVPPPYVYPIIVFMFFSMTLQVQSGYRCM